MQVATSAQYAALQLDAAQADTLVNTIGIPPRPQTLAELQDEIAQANPDFHRVAHLVSADVALSALLRVVNSPPTHSLNWRAAWVASTPTWRSPSASSAMSASRC
ncbi:MAG TPA: HDOD domain-containing protein [Rubrivivax sp.]